MGCLSVNVSQVLPTVAVDAKVIGGVSASALNANTGIAAASASLNGIGVVISKTYNDARVAAGNKNADMAISAWLVCKVGTGGIYLAVTEGLVLTLDKGYLKVMKG